jgi:hypothetical protein
MKKNKMTSGQSLIEFALALFVFFPMVMGLFDMGLAIFFYSTLNTAVREGTRFAIVQPDCDYKLSPGTCSGVYVDSYPEGEGLNCINANSTANINICNEIVNIFFGIGGLSSSTIKIYHPDSGTPEPKINIGIEYTFNPITPGIGDFTLHVESQMLMTPIAVP